MSDTRLRELERRWKISGTVEDEAAYLLERVRVGNLSRENLKRLAKFDHPAGYFALQNDHRRWYYTSDEHYIRGIASFGGETLARVAMTCAAEVLPAWEESPLHEDVRPHDLLIAGIRALMMPTYATFSMSTEAKNVARIAANHLEWILNNFINLGPTTSDRYQARFHAQSAAETTVRAVRTILVDESTRLDQCIQAYRGSLIVPHGTTTRFQAISRDLIAWALGNDPLPALLARLESEAGA